MTKEELEDLLAELKIPCNEGIQSDKNTNAEARICYWEYLWDPLTASDTRYNTVVTYQISFYAFVPRHKKLLELKQKLESKKIFPVIQHEYNIQEKCFHSYFPIEVLENV